MILHGVAAAEARARAPSGCSSAHGSRARREASVRTSGRASAGWRASTPSARPSRDRCAPAAPFTPCELLTPIIISCTPRPRALELRPAAMDAFISRELRGVDRAVRRKEADLAHSSVSVDIARVQYGAESSPHGGARQHGRRHGGWWCPVPPGHHQERSGAAQRPAMPRARKIHPRRSWKFDWAAAVLAATLVAGRASPQRRTATRCWRRASRGSRACCSRSARWRP